MTIWYHNDTANPIIKTATNKKRVTSPRTLSIWPSVVVEEGFIILMFVLGGLLFTIGFGFFWLGHGRLLAFWALNYLSFGGRSS